MRTKWIVLGVIALAAIATLAMAAQSPPEEIVIDAAADKQSPVTFPHKAHIDMVDSCVTCHHTQDGLSMDSDMKVQKCSECHLNPEGDVPSMSEMSPKKNPLHVGCIDCHKEQDKGPTGCFDCHPKG